MIYNFLSIGDTVTDAFIRIKDASLHCSLDKERCEICFRFADKVPYEDVTIVPAVGNSANAAVAAARLGLSAAVVSDVGDDYFGKECLDALGRERVATEFVKAHAGRKTNYHYVLWYEDDRTILIKHEEYDYALSDVGAPRWAYLSSLGGNSLPFHRELEEYFSAHPEIKLAFQPGTFQMKFGREALAGIYQRAEVFICNKEESQRILGTDEHDIKKLLAMIGGLGPKIVVITDGPAGAYAYDASTSFDKTQDKSLGTSGLMWYMPPYPDPKPPYERTGAGDAFSSTFVAFLALGMSVEEALMRAPINSMSVVQYIGAREGLLTREKLEEYLANAPEDYKPKKI